MTGTPEKDTTREETVHTELRRHENAPESEGAKAPEARAKGPAPRAKTLPPDLDESDDLFNDMPV